MWVAYGLVIAVVVAAAVFDWQARRRGHGRVASWEHWEAARVARRDARRRFMR